LARTKTRTRTTYQHQLLVLLLQQAAVEELVLRDDVGEIESLAAQAFVGTTPKAQSHDGLALRNGKSGNENQN